MKALLKYLTLIGVFHEGHLVDLNKEMLILFNEVMRRCRMERKRKCEVSIRALADQIGKTPNFVSAFEGGREFPSIKTFLKYLLASGFDVAPLTSLSIEARPIPNELDRLRSELSLEIENLDEAQLKFLIEQTKVLRTYRMTD